MPLLKLNLTTHITSTTMSTGNRKRIYLNTAAVKLGCSRNSRLAAFFSRRRRGSSSATTTSTADTPDSGIKSLRAVQGFGRIGGQSVAVEKDSDDPYLDFRRSMIQMILEKHLYSEDDLKELLNCFLQLNSPCYHGIIVRAFTEIWNGVCSSDVGPSASPDGEEARMYSEF